MFDIEGSLDRQVLSVPRNRPTVIFVESLDPRVVEAACHLARFVRPVFLAPEPVIRGVVAGALGHVDANRVEFALSESAFLDLDAQPELIEVFASDHLENSQEAGQKITIREARRFLSNPAPLGLAAR